MSLDLEQVRAFVTAAEVHHFGRAATRLHLTQQGVSRRITTLERRLGVRLFHRRAGGVDLSSEGDRFLPHARRLLAVAETAIESVDPASAGRPLRVDVWGPTCWPLRLLRQHVGSRAESPVEISMRRDSDASVAALERGEIDAAFVCGTAPPWESADLEVEVACTEPLAAGIPVDHPLADADHVTTSALRQHGLWWPVHDTPDLSRQVLAYAMANRIPILTDGRSMGVEFMLDSLVGRTDRIGLYGVGWPTEHTGRVRVVPIEEPGPNLVWTLVWHHCRPHPELERLRRSIAGCDRRTADV